MVGDLKAQVKWLSEPDADQRLRKVYELLLREDDRRYSKPTIKELLLKGLNGGNHDGRK